MVSGKILVYGKGSIRKIDGAKQVDTKMLSYIIRKKVKTGVADKVIVFRF